jgi:hypothetical protein
MTLMITEAAEAWLYTTLQYRRWLPAASAQVRRCLGSATGAHAPPVAWRAKSPLSVARHTVGVLPLVRSVSGQEALVGKRNGADVRREGGGRDGAYRSSRRAV